MNSTYYSIPTVSIIIPNYNHGSYLEQRIQSVLDQSYEDFEIILLDDCSTDSSMDVINNYLENDKIVHFFLNDKNSDSPFGLWQYGIEKARGKYIWIAESDDWAADTFLAETISVLENNEVVLVHTNSMYYRSNEFRPNTWWDSFKSENWTSNYIKDGKHILNKFGRFKCPVINVSSAVFRKDIIKENFYPFGYRYCGDWKFWIDVFMTGKVAFIAKPLNTIRVHNTSATSNKKDNYLKKLNENIKVINYANNILNYKTIYTKDYRWLIDLWISIFENTGQYFAKTNHSVDLPVSFKFRFYKLYFKLILKRGYKKIKTIYDS